MIFKSNITQFLTLRQIEPKDPVYNDRPYISPVCRTSPIPPGNIVTASSQQPLHHCEDISVVPPVSDLFDVTNITRDGQLPGETSKDFNKKNFTIVLELFFDLDEAPEIFQKFNFYFTKLVQLLFDIKHDKY